MKKIITPVFLVLLVSCSGGGGTISLTQVLGIPAGDKEGSALSGTFSTRIEYVDNGCADFPALQIPSKNTTSVANVVVTQDAGAVAFEDILNPVFGGVYFDNHYEVGGTASLDVQGDRNILRAVYILGKFVDPNTYEGNGQVRMVGRIEAKEIDCSYRIKISGIRS